MRLGLYFDLRDPPRWRRGWDRVYGQALELIEEADRRGVGSVWLSEHHLFDDGYLPQPLVFAAAVAARTRTARIGTAVLLAPLRAPIAIAEEAAVVDIVSHGRLELGLGAGYRVPEYEAFAVDSKRRYELLEQSVSRTRELWSEGRVTPTPLQSQPPIWLGAHGPRASRMAGRLGVGLLSLSAELWPVYLEAYERAGHSPAEARASGPMTMLLADDPERVRAQIQPHADYQWESYQRYAQEGREQAETPFRLPPMFRDRGAAAPPPAQVATVEQALARLRKLRAAIPVEHVFLWERIGGMPEQLVERHVELLLDRLIPALAADEAADAAAGDAAGE